jgi:hypothetical protein
MVVTMLLFMVGIVVPMIMGTMGVMISVPGRDGSRFEAVCQRAMVGCVVSGHDSEVRSYLR